MSWDIKPTEFVKQVNEDHRDLTTAIAIAVTKGVIMDTPVDEGRLRGNWFPSEGNPSDEETDDVDKNGGTTINRAITFFEAHEGFYPVFYLTNNLPYAEYVNNGTDKVPALNFVENNIQRVNENSK